MLIENISRDKLITKLKNIYYIRDKIMEYYNTDKIFDGNRCIIEFIYDDSIDKEELAEYKFDILNSNIYNKKICIYLNRISDTLLHKFLWKSYIDIDRKIRILVLHEYRHYLQIEKLYELDLLDYIDNQWVIDLLEEDAESYSIEYVMNNKILDLTLLITKILVEDKINLRFINKD